MKEMSRRRSKAYRDAPSRTSRPDEFMELTPSKSTTSNPSPRSSTLRSCRNAELAVERSSTPPILTRLWSAGTIGDVLDEDVTASGGRHNPLTEVPTNPCRAQTES